MQEFVFLFLDDKFAFQQLKNIHHSDETNGYVNTIALNCSC